MPINLETFELTSKIKNAVDIFTLDRENSEFEDDPEVIDKLKQIAVIAEKVGPILQLGEDILFGEITPRVFMKRWKAVESSKYGNYNVDEPVDEIKPEVTRFLDKVSGNKPPKKSTRRRN